MYFENITNDGINLSPEAEQSVNEICQNITNELKNLNLSHYILVDNDLSDEWFSALMPAKWKHSPVQLNNYTLGDKCTVITGHEFTRLTTDDNVVELRTLLNNKHIVETEIERINNHYILYINYDYRVGNYLTLPLISAIYQGVEFDETNDLPTQEEIEQLLKD